MGLSSLACRRRKDSSFFRSVAGCGATGTVPSPTVTAPFHIARGPERPPLPVVVAERLPLPFAARASLAIQSSAATTMPPVRSPRHDFRGAENDGAPSVDSGQWML